MRITNITQRKLFFISIFFVDHKPRSNLTKIILKLEKHAEIRKPKVLLYSLYSLDVAFFFLNLFILLNFMFNGKAQIAALTEKHALHSAPYPLHALHSTFVVFVYAALHYPLLNVNQSSVALMLVSHVWDALVLFFHKWGLCG